MESFCYSYLQSQELIPADSEFYAGLSEVGNIQNNGSYYSRIYPVYIT